MASIQIWRTNAALQISSGAVSFICSSSLAYMIKANKKNNKGLTTPYRRLIFAISAADILQSLSIVLGPFITDAAVPMAHWAIGNKNSCQVDGLLFALGTTLTPLYSCSLSIYYYCKLYKKMPNDTFFYKIERWMHIGILSYAVLSNIYALGADMFNSSVTGTYCIYTVRPTGCRQRPDLFGECHESPDPDSVKIMTILNVLFIPVACLLVTVMLLSIILWKTVLFEKLFRSGENGNNAVQQKDDINEQNIEVENLEKTDSKEPVSASSKSNVRSHYASSLRSSSNRRRSSSRAVSSRKVDETPMAQAYRQEITAQLILYSCSFLIVYVVYEASNIMLQVGSSVSLIQFGFNQVLFPLQGFFNMLIFMRPAARVTRLKRPGTSWLKAYYLVMKNGGEAVNDPERNNSVSVPNFALPSGPIEFPLDSNVDDLENLPNEGMINSDIIQVSSVNQEYSVANTTEGGADIPSLKWSSKINNNLNLSSINEDGVCNDASQECMQVSSAIPPSKNSIASNSGAIADDDYEFYKLEFDSMT